MRLNNVIRALEAGTDLRSPPSRLRPIESAIEFATTKYDGVVFEAEHNPYDITSAARLPAVHAESQADRRARVGVARGDADHPHSAERRRNEPVARQTGARHRRLRRRLAARQHGGAGLQRRRGVPLPARERFAGIRAGRHPRRSARPRRTLLGHHAAGVLQEGRRLAARPRRRDSRHHHVRGRAAPSTTCRASSRRCPASASC